MLQTLSWASKGAAESGDFDPGQGISTAGKTVPAAVQADAGNISGVSLGANLRGTPAGHPVAWWIGLLVLYLVFKAVFLPGEKTKTAIADIIDTGFKAMLFLAVAHWFFTWLDVPGASGVVLSA